MTRKRVLSLLALLTTLVMVTAACGQKAGVHLATGGSGSSGDGEFVDEEFAPDEGSGDAGGAAAADGGGDAGGGGEAASAGGGASSGGSSGAGSRSTRRSGGSGATATTLPGGGGSTGPVWGKTIVLGVHAPITGAAPLPQTFRQAATFFEDYINVTKGGIHGRQIKIEVVDDEYQPATAVQRCKELVQQKNAFILIGGGGTDQIQACARYAAKVGVPYLSAGVTEIGLRSLKGYFAVSMSYKQQGPYLANFLKQQFPTLVSDPKKVWMVYSDTPNFGDARDAFLGAMPSGVQTKRLSRTPNGAELTTAIREVCDAGATVAYPLMAPAHWLIMLTNQPNSCNIQWAGVGLTMGLNTVTNTACKEPTKKINGATFFSPFPGTDTAFAQDPEFQHEITRRGLANTYDDIYVALWAINKGLADLLQRVGPSLSRSAFVKSTETATGVQGGFKTVTSYAPDNHFGAETINVLRANCDEGKYKTLFTNTKF